MTEFLAIGQNEYYLKPELDTMWSRLVVGQQNQILLKADSSTPWSHNFKINGNKISFKQRQGAYYSQILVDQVIPNQYVYYFKIKIIKSMNSALFVGMTDRKQYRLDRNSQQQKEVFSFLGKKAIRFPGRIQEQFGFTEGDIVTIKIDRKQSKITWYVNSRKVSSSTNTFINDTKHQYVPFFQMIDANDQIQWLGSYIQK